MKQIYIVYRSTRLGEVSYRCFRSKAKAMGYCEAKNEELDSLETWGGNEMNTCYVCAPCDFDEEDVNEYS